MYCIRYEVKSIYFYLLLKYGEIYETCDLEQAVPEDWKAINFMPVDINAVFDLDKKHQLIELLEVGAKHLMKTNAILLEIFPAEKTEWIHKQIQMSISYFVKAMYEPNGVEKITTHYINFCRPIEPEVELDRTYWGIDKAETIELAIKAIKKALE